jgi:hypothetical protein
VSNIPSYIALSPNGFDVNFGVLEASPHEGLPVLVFSVKVKGEVVTRWCVTEAALPAVERAVRRFRKELRK